MSLKRYLPVAIKRPVRVLADSGAIRMRTVPFWVATPLYRWTPGGFGRYRALRRARDETYIHERDKHPVRRKHFEREGWRDSYEQGIRRRDYADYDEYLVHQQQKLDEVLKLGGFFENTTVDALRRRFYRRFRHLVPLLPRRAEILCAAARQGTEVEVLRELGFRKAYGIDLNPGPANELVRKGDFHRLDAEDASLDLIYSNSLDHAFDLDRLLVEHRRALKDEGYALYDLPVDQEGGPAEAIAWRDDRVIFTALLAHFERVIRVETDEGWKWVLLQKVEPDGGES
jgi:SAM-dependent methyltransferase